MNLYQKLILYSLYLILQWLSFVGDKEKLRLEMVSFSFALIKEIDDERFPGVYK